MRRTLSTTVAILLCSVAAICFTQANDPTSLTRYTGSYSLGGNNFIWIVVAGDTLIFGESVDGRSGRLVSVSGTKFIAGPALGVDSPVAITAEFVANDRGEIESVKWKRGARAEQVAQKVKLKEEEVRFQNGNITLAGTLYLPPAKGPHPAMVLVTGSGPARRDQFGGFPQMFASMGVATLIYDKRGCGSSTGTFYDSLPIEELAKDALAGVEYLRSRADIDPRQVGMRGDSQGGWVVPYAAAQSRNVAFVIVKSASSLNTWDNGLFEMENDLRLEGFSESDIGKAREIGALFNEMLFDKGESWTRLRAAIESAKTEKWFRLARVPDSLPETPAAGNLRWVEQERKTLFDPQPYWSNIQVPVLVVNGGLDRNVPGKESAIQIEQLLKKAGNKNVTIKFFSNADHQLWKVSKLGQRDGRSNQVGVYQEIISWLAANTRRN
ncbi:MAG TPA: prolyl oligopeptidase family serine peptidase [Pyrinomonadaceae bacterium]|nr:prolyl oligopeptidase family serine peptidase [Pyrinomonadaceae bacterium]